MEETDRALQHSGYLIRKFTVDDEGDFVPTRYIEALLVTHRECVTPFYTCQSRSRIKHESSINPEGVYICEDLTSHGTYGHTLSIK
jgi:hypothetical protein